MLLKYLGKDENKKNNGILLEMANLRGKDVNIEDIDFSLFFSRKYPNHGCRNKQFIPLTKVKGFLAS